MVKKTDNVEKLKEDALVTEAQPQEMPAAQQATPDEVAQAQAAVQQPVVENETSAIEEELPVATEEDPTISTSQEASIPADPMTPPAPGMIPSGWVKPEDLASALAQETGDTEVATAAENATLTEQPIPTESAINQAQATTEPIVPTEEEQEVILEYRKYKASLGKKLVEEKDPITGNDFATEDSGDENVEDLADSIDDAVDEINDPDLEVSYDIHKEEAEEAGDEENPDDPVENEVEVSDDLMATINDFLDELDATAGDDEDDTFDPTDVLKATADFLDEFADDVDTLNFEDVKDTEEEPEDLPEETEETEEEDVELLPVEDEEDVLDEIGDEVEDEEVQPVEESSIKNISDTKSLKEDANIFYPAGSKPGVPSKMSSNIKASAENTLTPESNLVRSYEKTSAEKRRALKKYRENLLKENEEISTPNPRFKEALSSTVRITEEESHDKNSWASNKFLEKYEESQSFSFQQLLEEGFLG